MGFGALLGLFGLGGAWLHHQYGSPVFWGLGILGVLLLAWAFLNLRRGRIAGWTAAMAMLLVLVGFGSITLLGSPNQNLLTSDTIPDPLNNFRTGPAAPATPDTGAAPTPPVEPSPAPTIPETTITPDPGLPQPAPEPSPLPGPAEPSTAPLPPAAPSLPAASGSVREVEPACPCLLSVRVTATNPTIRILRGTTEIARSSLERSVFQLETGDYTLQVEAPGYRTFSALINVPRNKNLEVELVQ
jgi:hypothetical protein